MPAVTQPQQPDSMDPRATASSREPSLTNFVSGRSSSLPSRDRVSAAIALVRAKQGASATRPTPSSHLVEDPRIAALKRNANNPVHPTISMNSTLTTASSMRKQFQIAGVGTKPSVATSSLSQPTSSSRTPFTPVEQTEQKDIITSASEEAGKYILNSKSGSFIQNVFASRSEVKGISSSTALPNVPSLPDDAVSSPQENIRTAGVEGKQHSALQAASSVDSSETDSSGTTPPVDASTMKDIGQLLDKLHVKSVESPTNDQPFGMVPVKSGSGSEEDPVEALRQLSSDCMSYDSSDSDESEALTTDGVNQETLAEISAFIDAVAKTPAEARATPALKTVESDIEEKQQQVVALLDKLHNPAVKTDAPTFVDKPEASPTNAKQTENTYLSSSSSSSYDKTLDQLRTTRPSPIYEQVESLTTGTNKDPPAFNPDHDHKRNRDDPPTPSDLSEAVIRMREADTAVAPSYSAESLEPTSIIDESGVAVAPSQSGESLEQHGSHDDEIHDEKKESSDTAYGHSMDFFTDDYDHAEALASEDMAYLAGIGHTLSPVFETPSGEEHSVSSGTSDKPKKAQVDRVETSDSLDDVSEQVSPRNEQDDGSEDSELDGLEEEDEEDIVDYEELLLEALGTAASGESSKNVQANDDDPVEKAEAKKSEEEASEHKKVPTAESEKKTASSASSGESDDVSQASNASDIRADSSDSGAMERYDCLEQDDESEKSSAEASDIDSGKISGIHERHSEHKKLSDDDEANKNSDNDKNAAESDDLPHKPSLKTTDPHLAKEQAREERNPIPWELRDIASEETMKAAGRTRPRAVFTGQRRARVIKSLLSDDSSAVTSQVFPIESQDDFAPMEAKLGISDVVVFDEGDDIEVLETSMYLAEPRKADPDAKKQAETESEKQEDDDSEHKQFLVPLAPAPSGVEPAQEEPAGRTLDEAGEKRPDPDAVVLKAEPAPEPEQEDSVLAFTKSKSVDGDDTAEVARVRSEDDPDLIELFTQSQSEDESQDDEDLAAELTDSRSEDKSDIGETAVKSPWSARNAAADIFPDDRDLVEAFLKSGSMDQGDPESAVQAAAKSPKAARASSEVTQKALNKLLEKQERNDNHAGEEGTGFVEQFNSLDIEEDSASESGPDQTERAAPNLKVTTDFQHDNAGQNVPNIFSPSAIARYFVSLDDGDFSLEQVQTTQRFQRLIAPVIAGNKPSIIEAAQIRQAAQKAKIPLDYVDRFLDFMDDEQPTLPANVSSVDDEYLTSKWDDEMEELNEDEAIGAFLSRFGALKSGGHLKTADSQGNTSECKDEDVEVDAEFGYVNKSLEIDDEEDEEWWKGMSHLEKKAAIRQRDDESSDSEEDESDDDEESSEDDLSANSEIDSESGMEAEKRTKPPSTRTKQANFFPAEMDDMDLSTASFAYDTRTENAMWHRKKAMASYGKRWEQHSSWLSPRSSSSSAVNAPKPINGVAAAVRLGNFAFSKRLLLAVRRPWKLPYKERTKGHPGFFDVDVHSMYEASAVRPISDGDDVIITPWERREVKQRFLQERSIAFTRNWFGEMPHVRGNPKYKPRFCKPKSMEMPIENIPDPGEWTEEWYTVWKSPYERRSRLSGSGSSTDSVSTASHTDRGSFTDRGGSFTDASTAAGNHSNDESDYSGSSDGNESDDDSWEEAPECGTIINVKQKIGERVSRVHPDYTSSLRRSRWRKKYFPRGTFPYK